MTPEQSQAATELTLRILSEMGVKEVPHIGSLNTLCEIAVLLKDASFSEYVDELGIEAQQKAFAVINCGKEQEKMNTARNFAPGDLIQFTISRGSDHITAVNGTDMPLAIEVTPDHHLRITKPSEPAATRGQAAMRKMFEDRHDSGMIPIGVEQEVASVCDSELAAFKERVLAKLDDMRKDPMMDQRSHAAIVAAIRNLE